LKDLRFVLVYLRFLYKRVINKIRDFFNNSGVLALHKFQLEN